MKLFARCFQGVMYVACFFLDFSEPKLIKGENSFKELADLLKSKGKKKVLIVTDEMLHSKFAMDKKIYDVFEQEGLEYALFYDVQANPTVAQCEAGLKVYNENHCDSIVALGGGSAMDCAKGIGARATNPRRSIMKMKGILTVPHKLPLFIAVPTTAGTGSETTLAAVISNPETKEKFPIEDPHLIPKYAVLNPTLLVNLPGGVTSTTGMDALTHAVEAYIGSANTKKTKQYAKQCVELVFKYLVKSYNEPTDLEARENMQVAAFAGGVAFTRAYVGYVHALAHALGAFYHTPHGLANSVILPIVLEEFGSKAYKKLAELYDVVHPESELSVEEKAKKFIDEIYEMNKAMGIPRYIENTVKDEDIDALVEHSYKEGVPLYPTPEIWDRAHFKKMYYKIQGKEAK